MYANSHSTALQVKLRGFRIEVEEIEAVLQGSDLVRSAVVTVAGSPVRLVAWLRLHLEVRDGECGRNGGDRGGWGEGGEREDDGGGGAEERDCGAGGAREDSERARKEGGRLLEEGGECALRLLCMRCMPLHQIPTQMVALALPSAADSLTP